jgi:hypothetical protein
MAAAAYGVNVCDKFSKAINRLLKRFNAGFHLDRVRVEYTVRKLIWAYRDDARVR